MKSIYILILTFFIGFIATDVQADDFNDEWTCYTSNNYRGSKKMMNPGEYDNCNNWKYYSWKSKCCVKFYYYYRDGKKGEKVLCGDVRDLRNEMRKWGNLKYGHQGGWKNIYKAVFYCDGNDNYADNNHNNNNNNHGNYNDMLRKGQCVVWRDRGYKQDYDGYMPGKKYYPRDLKYKFWSLQCPDNYEVYWVYKGQNGRDEEYTCNGKISDLRSHFNRWNLRDRNKAWDYVQYFEIRKKGTGGNNQAANNNNNGNYNDLLRKGQCVVWRERGYKQDYDGYMPGKKYYPRDLKYKFWSLQCPDNYEVYWVYKGQNGRDEEYTCNGKISDLRSHFNRWNVRDRNKAWDYVQYFEIRKKGMGGNNNGGKYDDYKNKDWYNKYRNGGYIVFTQYKYFDGRYAGKVPGDYDNRKLGFYPQSVFIPSSSIYLVLEYKAKNGRTESQTIKESIYDLGKYLYEKGVYRDYEKDPYKAITRLAVIRQ